MYPSITSSILEILLQDDGLMTNIIESSNYPAFEVVDVEAASDQHVEDFWICMDLRLLNINNELNL